jgi:hypothetical protein
MLQGLVCGGAVVTTRVDYESGQGYAGARDF